MAVATKAKGKGKGKAMNGTGGTDTDLTNGATAIGSVDLGNGAVEVAPVASPGDGSGSATALAGTPKKAKGKGKAAAPAEPSIPSDEEIRESVMLLKNLSDPTRVKILLLLDARGPINVGELCGELAQSQPACSHHLAMMRASRLVEPIRQGKHNFYNLRDLGRAAVAAVKSVIGS